MNQKNANQSECNDEAPVNITPFKVKLNNSLKCDSQTDQTTASVLIKRENLNDLFTDPWRCDSANFESSAIQYHKPIYNSPCYFEEQLKNLTHSEKATRIMSYHYALNIHMNNFLKKQPRTALFGDQMQGSFYNGVIEKRKDFLQGDNSPDDENTYISRSGRHVRRRQDPSQFLMSDEEEERNNKRIKLDDSPKTSTVAKKHKKAANEESGSKSQFKDSQISQKSLRSQMMQNKLEEADKETERNEIIKSRFEQSLTPMSDDDDTDMISSSQSPNHTENTTDDGDFIRRRIEPPTGIKKGRTFSTKYSATPSTSSSSHIGEFCNTTTSSPKANGNAKSTPVSKRGPKKKITSCPICGNSFPTKEIEEHASTCGLTAELDIESNIPNHRGDQNTLY